jgi:hypothetical protein
MTNWAAWFKGQLASSGDGFVWAFGQIEPELRDPPRPRPAWGYGGARLKNVSRTFAIQ